MLLLCSCKSRTSFNSALQSVLVCVRMFSRVFKHHYIKESRTKRKLYSKHFVVCVSDVFDLHDRFVQQHTHMCVLSKKHDLITTRPRSNTHRRIKTDKIVKGSIWGDFQGYLQGMLGNPSFVNIQGQKRQNTWQQSTKQNSGKETNNTCPLFFLGVPSF